VIGLLLASFVFGLQDESLAASTELARTVLRVEDDATMLALSDVDGDGDQDLLLVDSLGIHVRLLSDAGTFSDADDVLRTWPAENLAWTLVDLAGDGRTSLAAYVDGREVRTWRLDRETEEGGLELAFAGSLPRGRFQMSFYRDVDADGRLDLVLPAFGEFAIHLRGADGVWSAPLDVKLEAEVDYDVGDPRSIRSKFGQDVKIPWFTLEDVDGDGDVDLVAESEDEVLFHLAEPVLAGTPTWRLDLAALRAELPPEGDMDLSNLIGGLTQRTVAWKLADLDGEPPHDLVLQTGSKFSVYRGASRTGPGETASQVLKSSGNVLLFFLRDVEGSELLDLQILRGEELSVATILRWLILPGSFDFELFTYRNDAGSFSRRPTRRNTLELSIPRLLAFAQELEELEEEKDFVETVPARRVALGVDGEANDVVDLVGDELCFFLDRAPPSAGNDLGEVDDLQEALEAFLFKDLDALEDGETKTYDLRELVHDVHADHSAGPPLRAACAGVEPDQRVALVPGLVEHTIHARDLNGDGRLDLLVAGKEGEEAWVVQFFVR